MDEANNVFISWSGARSKAAATALHEWLPMVVQNAKPWMSDADIEKGSRGLEEVGKALEGMKVGIICLTPENKAEAWIHFEAGALSKTLDAKSRVCTYLLAGLRLEDVAPPLGIFQATTATKEDTRRLVGTVYRALDGPLSENSLNMVFDNMWHILDKKLENLPPHRLAAEVRRSEAEILADVLEGTRTGTRETLKMLEQIRADVLNLTGVLPGALTRERRRISFDRIGEPIVEADTLNRPQGEVTLEVVEDRLERLRSQVAQLSKEHEDAAKKAGVNKNVDAGMSALSGETRDHP